MSCCGGKSGKKPKTSEMMKNLTLSVANVVKQALRTGKIMASEATITKRVNICNSCRHFDKGRCNVCGCFLSVKTGLSAEKCPIKKW